MDKNIYPDVPLNIREQNNQPLDLDLVVEVMPGRVIPDDWYGSAFWLVPTPQGDNESDRDYGTPWFNAYAQLYRLDFAGQKVHLKSEQLRTPSVICDQQLQELSDIDSWRKKSFRFENKGGLSRLSSKLGVQNQCNTALQAFEDPKKKGFWRIFATVDSGIPYEFNSGSLKLTTPIGKRNEWTHTKIRVPLQYSSEKWIFPMVASGAHPAYDQKTGEVFFINCLFDIKILLIRQNQPQTQIHIWDGHGDFHTVEVLDEHTGKPVNIKQSSHQISITENYIVIIDTAFRIEYLRVVEDLFWGLGTKAKAHSVYNRIWLVPRKDIGQNETVYAKHIELPRECVHFYTDYEDSGGEKLVLHTILASGHDVSEWLQENDTKWSPNGRSERISHAYLGSPPGVYDKQGFGKYEINATTGQVEDLDNFVVFEKHWGIGLPTHTSTPGVSPDRVESLWVNYGGYIKDLTPTRLVKLYSAEGTENLEYRHVVPDDLPQYEETRSGILRWDTNSNYPGNDPDLSTRSEPIDYNHVDRGTAVYTPVFVPKKEQPKHSSGYIVAMVHTPTRSEFWVWDAYSLQDGPVAKMYHDDVKFAFPLHATWIPSISTENSEYRNEIREYFKADDSKYDLPQWLKDIFDGSIYPQFDQE